VFAVLIPDNAPAIVADADPVNPRFTVGWLDYAQHCGFGTDPARVRHANDKPRVERSVQYVRGNLFAGEEFVDLADAQARAEKWCAQVAGLRVHGTTQARPAEVFAAAAAGLLLPVPEPYDVPILQLGQGTPRLPPVDIGKALYSAKTAPPRPSTTPPAAATSSPSTSRTCAAARPNSSTNSTTTPTTTSTSTPTPAARPQRHPRPLRRPRRPDPPHRSRTRQPPTSPR
jgi:hypothetical protein